MTMPESLDDVLRELRHELILRRAFSPRERADAFGHVSVRHPRDPRRYFHSAPLRAGIGGDHPTSSR